jgi:hypothetical protein
LAGPRDILGELDDLIAQSQMDDAHAGVKHALQFAPLAADQAKIGDFFELQDFGEEARFPVHVGDSEVDGFYALHLVRQPILGVGDLPACCQDA